MRHRKKGKKIGRKAGHRKRTLQALSQALIENKRIRTTLPKAKALRPFVEPLITRATEDTTHNRQQVFRHLQDKQAVRELFDEVADAVGDRPGGYTRIIKLGRRSGDGAQQAMIELVDYNDVPPSTPGGGRSRTRRGSGKGRRDASDDPEQPSDEAAPTEEETAEASDKAQTADADETTDETASTEADDAEKAKAADGDEAADDEAAAEEPEAQADDDTASADDSDSEQKKDN